MKKSISRPRTLAGAVVLWLCVAMTNSSEATVVGNVASFTSDPSTNSVVFACAGTQKVKLTFCKPEVVKVEFDAAGTFTHPAWTNTTNMPLASAPWNLKTWPAVSFTATDEGTLVRVQTSKMTIRVNKSPLRISYYNAANTTLITGDAAPMESKGYKLTMSRTSAEHFFGYPDEQQWVMDWKDHSPLDKTGHVVVGQSPIMYSTGGYGVLVVAEGPWNVPSVDISVAGAVTYSSTWGTDEGMIYYFMVGPGWKDVMMHFTDITGKPPQLWKKYYGIARTWWPCDGCFNTGTNTEQFFDFARNFAKGNYPSDVLVYDVGGNWAALGNANPNATVPRIQELADTVRAYGNVMGGQVQGFGVPGYCPECKGTLDKMPYVQTAVDHGFDFAWYDAMGDYSYQQAWNMNHAWREAHRGDNSRAMVRMGWTAYMAHEFPYAHMGDFLTESVLKTFAGHLEASLGATNYSGCDLSLAGWNIVASALRPMITFHLVGNAGGGGGGSGAELLPWKGDAEGKAILTKWHGLHYRFIPYLFTYGGIAHETGVATWRPMMAEDPTNPATWDKNFQGYVGDYLIQAPYAENDTLCSAGKRSGIMLPQGTWFDYWDGTAHTGPTTINNYVCDPTGNSSNYKLPLFVKAGAIIPLMPAMQHVGQRPEDTLTLCVWPSGSSSFTLHEDEVPVKTAFGCLQTGSQTDITIGAFAGSRYCADATKRQYVIELHGTTTPQVVKSGTTTLTKQTSKAGLDAAASGWFFDAANGGITYAKPNGNAVTGFAVLFCQTGDCAKVSADALNQAIGGREYTRLAGSRRIECAFVGEYRGEAFSASGRVIKAFTGRDVTQVALPQSAAGLCFVKIVSGATVSLERFIIR